jgi:signal transduction histidine kinase
VLIRLPVLLVLVPVLTAAAVTVGYTRNPPFTSPQSAGAPSGFAVEVLSEAARRAGIELNWKLVDAGSEPLWLRDPEVQIWPAGVSSEERRRHLYITAPWWRTELVAVTRPEFESLDALVGRRIAATRDVVPTLGERIVGSLIVPSITHSQSAVSLCQGSVDAFVTDRVILDQLLLDRPAPCAEVPLHLIAIPGASIDLSILARPEAREIADSLRSEIDTMEANGTIAEIAMKYPAISAASARFMTSIMRTEYRYDLLRLVLILVTALLAVAGFLLFRMYREVVQRKRTENQLRETNSDLQQFSYAASHDLSEPLRNMILYSEVLDRRYGHQLDDQARHFLTVIQQGGRRMQRLLDSLREYAELSRESAPAGEISCDEVLDHALESLQDRIQATGAVITRGPLPNVRFGESRLLQVFQNLISNALKYRGSREPRIQVTARRESGEWIFQVADNGAGIAPEYHEKIFDVFKRLHAADVAGAGLGLAICKRIIERAGGRIWVESQKDEGAQFYFTIRGTEARPGIHSP